MLCVSYFVQQAGINLRNPPVSSCRMLKLKSCIITYSFLKFSMCVNYFLMRNNNITYLWGMNSARKNFTSSSPSILPSTVITSTCDIDIWAISWVLDHHACYQQDKQREEALELLPHLCYRKQCSSLIRKNQRLGPLNSNCVSWHLSSFILYILHNLFIYFFVILAQQDGMWRRMSVLILKCTIMTWIILLKLFSTQNSNS